MPLEIEPEEQAVFLNIPFDKSYDKIFVGFIASLISIGRIPRTVLEISEQGQGRLNRILDLLAKCRISIHDISMVGTPVRFNMPFELGLACSLSKYPGNHSFIIFEKKRHRHVRTISDLRLCDPYIHNGSIRGVVNGVLDALASKGNNPDPREVWRMAIDLNRVANELKQNAGQETIFSRNILRQLVSASVELAIDRGFISP